MHLVFVDLFMSSSYLLVPSHWAVRGTSSFCSQVSWGRHLLRFSHIFSQLVSFSSGFLTRQTPPPAAFGHRNHWQLPLCCLLTLGASGRPERRCSHQIFAKILSLRDLTQDWQQFTGIIIFLTLCSSAFEFTCRTFVCAQNLKSFFNKKKKWLRIKRMKVVVGSRFQLEGTWRIFSL